MPGIASGAICFKAVIGRCRWTGRSQWVYGHTTVTRRWIAENLRMGYESGVSRAVSFVESSAANEVMTMKSKLRNTDVR